VQNWQVTNLVSKEVTETKQKALDEEICQSLIDTSYDVCSEIWNLIDPQNKDEPKNAEPKNLFWVLLFMET
jgi:hypothetical protein